MIIWISWPLTTEATNNKVVKISTPTVSGTLIFNTILPFVVHSKGSRKYLQKNRRKQQRTVLFSNLLYLAAALEAIGNDYSPDQTPKLRHFPIVSELVAWTFIQARRS
jgi:hypothetical protein